MISSSLNLDAHQFRAELEALERLCRYVTSEAAALKLPEAERHASAAAATIRERIRQLSTH